METITSFLPSPQNPLELVFQDLAGRIGFPVDKVRYILLMLFGYPLALVLRHALHPSHTPLHFRYIYSLSMGLVMGFLCFHWQQMAVLVLVVLVSYLLLHLIPPTHTHRYTMVWAMGSLSVAHIYRMILDYGGYQLDFTGPLMIMVQKITLVAFAVHDGRGRPDSALNQDQREQKIVTIPGLLEYYSFMFNFHSFLAGPICTVKEYMAFMDGSNFGASPQQSTKVSAIHIKEPSAVFPLLSKLAYSLISVCLFVLISNYVDSDVILKPHYSQPYRLVINAANCFRIRTRYYFVWLLAESINNAAGLGFAGYDKEGAAKWDLITNLYVTDIELATSIRTIASRWNAQTSCWLRRCVYERSTFSPTWATFLVSAWWHGFYPGYYLTFMYMGMMVVAARKMRRLVRPWFQKNQALRVSYAVITWLFTRVYFDFGVPFDLMLASKCFIYWNYYYYIPIITCGVVIIFFPSGKKHQQDSAPTEDGGSTQTQNKEKTN